MKMHLTIDLDEAHAALVDLHARLHHDTEVAALRATTILTTLIGVATVVEEVTT
jgi:hypothetical protein